MIQFKLNIITIIRVRIAIAEVAILTIVLIQIISLSLLLFKPKRNAIWATRKTSEKAIISFPLELV
jgi:hypothetical protein